MMRKIISFLYVTFFCVVNMMAQVTFDFSTAQRGPVIGSLHYGIFYEEINHAGDGGLYAELIRNGSMEENANNPDYWWTIGNATFSISSQNFINAAQKRAMHLNLTKAGDGTRNIGYWGINIVKGQKYRASFWLRTANNWTGDITLTLENYEGSDMGHAVVKVSDGSTWKKYSADIIATGNAKQGWFAIRGSRAGTIYLDCVSLMPPTFKNRENGIRPDLAEKLAALHPRFMRFPGGCYIEGGNRYQWRHTVGPVEERLGIYNSNWGYPVSNGMGFHEFLQLAEDLGAEPLFVVNVGMGHGWCQDYQHIEGFIQEALDALEYANGDITTFWGAKRAAAGHPEPFNLRLIEIGNENYNFHANNNSDQSDHYAERFKQFYDAIKARWPEVVCIGNVESWGTDNPTWRNQYAVDVVDEHYYRSPDWFASNYHKYDNASRSNHKIYNGEYAVTQDFGVNGTLKAALGEAIYMAGMERNSDVCVMASYAPIFMNENEAQWRPDMIHYNAYSSFGTPSYWAQQMMASTVGYQNITWTETGNSISLSSGARLGLGSWNTSVTYSNIKVTKADGTILYENSESVNSPVTMQGTAQILDVITDDCTIEMDAMKNSGDEGFLLCFAYGDANNYAWWNLGGWGNARHGIEQATDGVKTTLSEVNGTIEQGRTYHLKVVRNRLSAQCYMDDKLIQTAMLSASSGQRLYVCAALNEAEDTVIVKVINYNGTDVPTVFHFSDAIIGGVAHARMMSNSDNYAENTMDYPMKVSPKNRTLNPDSNSPTDAINYTVPAYSLSVITIPLSSVNSEVKQQSVVPPSPIIHYGFEEGKPQDDTSVLHGSLQGGASILKLVDGNHALYTGPTNEQGYMDMGSETATAVGNILNGEEWSVSLDILLPEGGNLNQFCWAWNINNGTAAYAGLINQPNNLNWYFEKVGNGTCKVCSDAGLSQCEWHNITVTSDAEATRIYVDGQIRNTQKTNTTRLTLTNTTKAWLGRSPFAGDAYMTNTFMDNLAIFNCVLTPAQVLSLYEAATNKATYCETLQSEPDTDPNAEAIQLIGNGTEVDITALLKNPDFAQGNSGWEGTPFSAAPGTVVEHFFQIFDTYQVLRKMPAGQYRLEWQGFYRNGNIQNAYLRHMQEAETEVEVYTATIEGIHIQECATTPMLSLYDSSVPYTYEPYTYPDNVTTANQAFTDGHYVQHLDFQLSSICDLRIGLRRFSPAVYDWTCCDNFRLIYKDNTSGIVDDVKYKSPNAPSSVYDLMGRRVSASKLDMSHSNRKGIYIVGDKKVLYFR